MNFPMLQHNVGPYTYISRAASRKIAGLQLTVLIYGAYNAMGLVGSECNGLLVLNEGQRDVLADEIAQETSGYYGPSVAQLDTFTWLCTASDADFAAFINAHPRHRYEIAANVAEGAARRRAALNLQPTTKPDSFFAPFRWVGGTNYTVEEKAKYVHQFARFVRSDFKVTVFPDWFYQRTSGMWHHIAHFNKQGFYHTWFASTSAKVDFLKRCLDGPFYGDPEWTMVDVERAIKQWLEATDVLGQYTARLAAEEIAAERATLGRLQQKYVK